VLAILSLFAFRDSIGNVGSDCCKTELAFKEFTTVNLVLITDS
jgi:hypothetical protein